MRGKKFLDDYADQQNAQIKRSTESKNSRRKKRKGCAIEMHSRRSVDRSGRRSGTAAAASIWKRRCVPRGKGSTRGARLKELESHRRIYHRCQRKGRCYVDFYFLGTAFCWLWFGMLAFSDPSPVITHSGLSKYPIWNRLYIVVKIDQLIGNYIIFCQIYSN